MKNWFNRGLLVFALSSMIYVPTAANAEGHKWPIIEPFTKTFTFSSQKDMYLHFSINDAKGREVYIVECASPFAADPRVRDYAYSRDFECHVAVPGAVLLPDIQLLAFNANVDKEWESRGGFWWSELTPSCQSYPDWGATRIYRFRHMQLSIKISDVDLVPVVKKKEQDPLYKIQGLKITISGEVDMKANRSYGGYYHYPEPSPVRKSIPDGYQNCDIKSNAR